MNVYLQHDRKLILPDTHYLHTGVNYTVNCMCLWKGLCSNGMDLKM